MDPNEGLPPHARKRHGNLGWDIALAIALGLLGLLLVANVITFLVGLVVDLGTTVPETPAELLAYRVLMWASAVGGLVVMGLVPFLWVLRTRVGGWEGARQYLQLHGPARGLLLGTGLGLLLVGAMVGLGLLLEALGFSDPDQEALLESIALDWPLVLALSISAGVGEEILFRGVLQKRLGIWGQAGLFGLFHLAQGVLGLVVTFAIGLLFGALVRRGHSLWLVIAAHVVYDAVLLGSVLVMKGG